MYASQRNKDRVLICKIKDYRTLDLSWVFDNILNIKMRTPPTKKEIVQTKKELEMDIIELLKETNSDFSLEDVKDVIYNETNTDDMMKAVAMFDNGPDASMLSNILELTNDAWNYFPHKLLGGLSPMEKILEYNSSVSFKKK